MDGQGDILFAMLLFVGLFLNWIKAVISAAIAVFVRHPAASVTFAAAIGAVEGLVGSRLELVDLYLTRDGWSAIDVLTALQVTVSMVASTVWWGFARGIHALVRRILS